MLKHLSFTFLMLFIPSATICMDMAKILGATTFSSKEGAFSLHAQRVAAASSLFVLLKSPDNKLVLLVNQKNDNIQITEQPYTAQLLQVFRKSPQCSKVQCLIQSRWMQPIRERLLSTNRGDELSLRFALQNSEAGNPLACEYLDATLIQSRLLLICDWLTWIANQQPTDGISAVNLGSGDLDSFSIMLKTVYGTELNGGSNILTVEDLLLTIVQAKKAIQEAFESRPKLAEIVMKLYSQCKAEEVCIAFFTGPRSQNMCHKVNEALARNKWRLGFILKTLDEIVCQVNVLACVYMDVQQFIKLEEALKNHTKIIFFSDHFFNNLGRKLIDHYGFACLKDMMVTDGPFLPRNVPTIEAFTDFQTHLMSAAIILVDSCNICGQTEKKLLKCGRCKNAYYCSVGCQQKDWLASHKERCKPV